MILIYNNFYKKKNNNNKNILKKKLNILKYLLNKILIWYKALMMFSKLQRQKW